MPILILYNTDRNLMKFSIFFLFTFLFLFNANAQVYTGTVSPPNGGKHATIYKDPGFNWKNCDQYKAECVQLDWLTPGTEVKVTNVLKVSNIPGSTQAQTLYYEVEFSSDGQMTIRLCRKFLHSHNSSVPKLSYKELWKCT